MSTPERDLVRLPGAGGTLGARHRMWLAPGHLLLVETSGYRESYRRVELADIQAFSLRHTDTMMFRALISGGILLLLGALMTSASSNALIVLSILAAPFLVMLVADLVLGRSCQVQLHTPVQTIVLPSLGRLRRAHQVIERLLPLITEVQGTVPIEELQRRLDEARSAAASPDPATTSSA